ncbi:MAG: alpha-hydroxy-acid oxidizing protein [Chloroflexi bacterium]|nr:MAG: alpha-hydroxy-acid oxidizing protein [Chloroflexota bacterium]
MSTEPESLPFAAYQNEIYVAGVGGARPAIPLTPSGLEQRASELLSPEAFGYVAGGAGTEATVAANRAALDRRQLIPRHLRGVASRSLETELLGTRLPAPVLMAPIGAIGIVHTDGELGIAAAARATGVPFILSTVSSNPMETVATAAGEVARWFQLYWPRDREVCRSLVQRAEASGYGAIVLTVDTFQLAWRPRDLEHGFLPFLHGDGIANYLTDPVFRSQLPVPPEEDPRPAIAHWAEVFANPTLTWSDLPFLREITSLPIVLKGIQHPDDARRALDAGVDGIVVSNHGGRQVDGAIGSLDALPTVVDAVGGDIPILFDGGIRSGSDALKAIALGARAVLIGRPYAYALGIGGSEALTDFLRGFLAELEITIGLCGLQRPSEATPELLTA